MAELFRNYEVTHAPRSFWERLVRLFAISSVTHVVLLLVVLYVPTVRGMLGIASTLGGVEFVNEEYTRGRIRERATMIDFTGVPGKLYYPPGYFGGAPAGPEDALVVQQFAPPPPPPPPVRQRPVRTPKAQPTPGAEASPTPVASPEVATVTTTGTPDPAASPTPGGVGPQTEADVEKLAAVTNTKRPPRINAEPFKKLLSKGKEMRDTGKLDLNNPLQLSVEADLKPDGTLDNLEIKGETTPDMLALAREFIQALSDSKALSFVQDANHVTMNLALDKEKVAVEVVTEVATEQRAEELARGFNGYLFFGQLNKKGTDEGEIWKSMKISSEDKKIMMKFDMKREDAGRMLSKQIDKQAAST